MSRKNDPEVIDKERQVLELRRAGVSFDLIAQQVGYKAASGAYHAFTRALKRTLQQPADELRIVEIDRLDRLQRGIWADAIAGNPQAIDRVLKIMDRRAKLLGLDAPTKVQSEVTVFEGGSDIDREVQRLAKLLREGGSIKSAVATPTGETGTTTAGG